MKILIKRKAFTLAEVLITLGIIGIVAAMTIPSLMNNAQDKQFKEAAKEAYSKASQVINQMKQDNGGDLSSYRTNWISFKPAFMTYFKIAQDCNWSDCVAPSASSTVYKSLYGNAGQTGFMSRGQFVTSDGMFWGMYGNNSTLLAITVDVNGYTKGPNVLGRDTFMFDLSNTDFLLPMGANNTFWTGLCDRTVSSGAQGFDCMYYVMQGIDY